MKKCLSNDVAKNLEEGIDNMCNHYAPFQEAEMQVDPLLAHHFIKKVCDVIMTNEWDVFVQCLSAILPYGFKHDNRCCKIVRPISKEILSQLREQVLVVFHLQIQCTVHTYIAGISKKRVKDCNMSTKSIQ